MAKSGKVSRLVIGRTWAKRIAVLTSVTAVALGGGVAYAYWTTSGTGSGSAAARTFDAPVATLGTATAGQLYPGLTADGTTVGGDLVLSITNSNPFPVRVTAVAPGTGSLGAANAIPSNGESQDSANSACAANSGVSVLLKDAPTVDYGAGTSIPAHQSTGYTVTVKNVVSMSTASVTECQGASFSIPVSLSYVSAGS